MSECLDKEENGKEARPKYDQHRRLSKSNFAKVPAYSNMRIHLLVLDPIVVFRRINLALWNRNILISPKDVYLSKLQEFDPSEIIANRF